MKNKSFHAHALIVNPHSLIKETFKNTLKQSMKAKSSNAHIVNSKQHRKNTFRHT